MRRHMVRQHAAAMRKRGKPKKYHSEEERRKAALMRVKKYRQHKMQRNKLQTAVEMLCALGGRVLEHSMEEDNLNTTSITLTDDDGRGTDDDNDKGNAEIQRI